MKLVRHDFIFSPFLILCNSLHYCIMIIQIINIVKIYYTKFNRTNITTMISKRRIIILFSLCYKKKWNVSVAWKIFRELFKILIDSVYQSTRFHILNFKWDRKNKLTYQTRLKNVNKICDANKTIYNISIQETQLHSLSKHSYVYFLAYWIDQFHGKFEIIGKSNSKQHPVKHKRATISKLSAHLMGWTSHWREVSHNSHTIWTCINVWKGTFDLGACLGPRRLGRFPLRPHNE